jgi:hypothetical protein
MPRQTTIFVYYIFHLMVLLSLLGPVMFLFSAQDQFELDMGPFLRDIESSGSASLRPKIGSVFTFSVDLVWYHTNIHSGYRFFVRI